MPKGTRWDRHLSVAAGGDGLIGHAGAVLLRKLADHAVNRGTGPGCKDRPPEALRHRQEERPLDHA